MLARNFALVLFVAATAVQGADWPRWRGPANDGHAPAGTPTLSTLPAEPRVVWQVPAGPGLASPVVANGVVLAFDTQDERETLRALDAKTGAELWRAVIDEPFSDSQGPTGPRCTPLIDGDHAYAVSCRGELHCRALKDGRLLWLTAFFISATDSSATECGELWPWLSPQDLDIRARAVRSVVR